MTTYPSNQNRDWTATQAAPRHASAPDVATMAAYFPQTQARPTGSVPQAQAYGPAYGQAVMPQLAWSAEQPDFNSVPATYMAKQAWYKRPGVLALAAAGLVVAASAGLFGELHSSSGNSPVKPAAQSAPAPAAAPAPAPAPAPMPAAQPAAPSYRSSSQSTTSSGGYSKPASHQAPQSPPPPPAPQQQPYQSGQSDPSQWNNSNNYWSNHRDDNSYRWQGDHDNRWNFQNRDHDSDNSGSSSDHDSSGSSSDHDSSGSSSDHDRSNSSNDHGSDSHSDGNGNSK
jgi:hypothetical protein